MRAIALLLSLLCLSANPVGGAGDALTRAFCRARTFSSSEKVHAHAMTYAVRGAYAESLWGFRRACELDPRNALWWNDLGVTLLRMQRLRAAEAAFLAALQLDPASTSATNNLVEARAHLREAIGGGSGSEAAAVAVGGDATTAVAAGAGALQARALALDETEEWLAMGSGSACSSSLEDEYVRLVPPLNASSTAAFKAATGIRHSVSPLPRLSREDLELPANQDFAAGQRPYILKRAIPPRHAALRRAGDLAALAAGPLANETADFYPESMVLHTVHPYLLPFSRALQELLAPSGEFPLPTSPRGGRYLHVNLGNEQWAAYLATLAPFAVPAPLDTADAWLRAGLGEPLASDFAIGNHWRMLLVGSEGAGMFSHQDILKTASYQLQIAGVKTWHICAPSESAHLSVEMDMFAPDYARFPAALQARCFLDAVGPGDMIFYPADYWHQTLNTPKERGGLSLAITDTLVDASNYERVISGLRDKCVAPTPFNRGGMIKEVCDRLPALFDLWADMYE